MRWGAVLALVAIMGCVSVNKSVLAPGLPPVPAEDVQVFFESDSIPEHTRVAILNASGSQGFTNQGQMIDKLREGASKLGANAIVLLGVKEPGAGEKFENALVGGVADGQRRGEAIAIRIEGSGVGRLSTSARRGGDASYVHTAPPPLPRRHR